MSILDHQRLNDRRQAISDAILDLERGLLAEKIKIRELEFNRGREIPGTRHTYDDAAIDRSVTMCDVNIGRIEQVLADERAKLLAVDGDLQASHEILKMHGTAACRIGIENHRWVVTQRHLSGGMAKRHCSACGEKQAVGVPL